MGKKYYKLNTERKTITINDDVKPTKTDEADITLYIKCGYTLRHKSEKRVAIAKERMKETGFGAKKTDKTDNKWFV